MRYFNLRKLHTAGRNDNMLINGEAVYYSQAIDISKAIGFAVSYKITAGSAPDVKIELEQSPFPPATEHAADDNFKVPESHSALEANLTGTTRKNAAVSPVMLPWFRAKVTGNAGNSANTVLELILANQSED